MNKIVNNLKGIYIHIPFCDKKCNYCDFTTMIGQLDKSEEYIDLLLKEIDLYSYTNKDIDSIYIGGGTPSLLESKELSRLFNKLRKTFHIASGAEITIEANPATLNKEKIQSYKNFGINRISLGVQCFQDENLKLLGRRYHRVKIIEDIDLLRKEGFQNISIDLIYGFPNQKSEDILEDIEMIKIINPEHISWYNLIVEEKTVFGNLLDRGKLSLPTDEVEEDFYLNIYTELKKLGYLQYELSNFCKENFKSQHNLKYWLNEEYYGFGLGASGYLKQTRYKNEDKYSIYKEKINQGNLPYLQEEKIEGEMLRFEYIIMHMRLSEGFSLKEYQNLYDVDFLKINKNLIQSFIRSGHLEISKDQIYFTPKGFFLSNYFFVVMKY